MRLYTCLLGTCTYKYVHYIYFQSFFSLFAHVQFDCVHADEIFQSGQEGAESMTSQQVTLWLQALFLFAVVWSLGGTINGNSRKKFDVFYRNLIMGTNANHQRPHSVKLTKNNVFPERGPHDIFGWLFNDKIPREHLFMYKEPDQTKSQSWVSYTVTLKTFCLWILSAVCLFCSPHRHRLWLLFS